MQFARINDITMHYQIIGAPEGRPVMVFCNSLGTDFRIWRDVAVQLAGEVGILTYDKRGHGLSDAPAGDYAMQDHVDDLAGLLDHLGISNVIVCGLSVGGMIAQGLHASRPDLVRALILCDTAHRIGDAAQWNERIEAVQANGIPALSEGVLARWFTPGYRNEDNPEFAGYRNMLERQPVAGYAGTCAALRDTDYTEAAGAISVPTLCVVGSQDGATPPELVKDLAGLIPGSGYQVISGAGHLPCIEKPDELTALIRSFISGL